jgi:hypothetical protein
MEQTVCPCPSLLSTTDMWVPRSGSSSTSLLSLFTRKGADGGHGRDRWNNFHVATHPPRRPHPH